MSPDPATALAEHKARCPACRAERTRPGAPLCARRSELTRAWREWLRDAPSMQRQAQEAGEPVIERWHNHPNLGICGPLCPARGTEWDGRGVVADHFTSSWDERP